MGASNKESQYAQNEHIMISTDRSEPRTSYVAHPQPPIATELGNIEKYMYIYKQ